MTANIENWITKTSSTKWKPLKEEGVDTTGIYVKSLRFDAQLQRSPSILLKFERGSKYPFHNHPAGEEIFLLKGSCFINNSFLNKGDYLYTPPGFKHSVRTEAGCEMLLIIPAEVEILIK
jgi:quercetin dioxygenase-like cupin family protein